MPLTAATRFDTLQPDPATVISIMSLVEHPSNEPTLDEIARAVCEVFHMKRHMIRGHRREIASLRARAVYYKAARGLTSKSLVQVGHVVDRTWHAVLHSLKQVKNGEIDIAAEYSAVLATMGRGGE